VSWFSGELCHPFGIWDSASQFYNLAIPTGLLAAYGEVSIQKSPDFELQAKNHSKKKR
jgi:hypothetical protein